MIKDLFSLKGKIALITGSSRGIGYALAEGLGEAGCTIILNGTHDDRLTKSVQNLAEKNYTVYGSLFDVTDEDSVQKKITHIEQDIGPIDILINNAGITVRGPLEEFNLSDWQRIIDINLTGVFITTKSVVPGMIKRSQGKIINICSVQSKLARPTIAPYAASKGGLKLLTQGMATDWGKYNIQVNGIAPGYFKTELTQKLYEDKEFNAWLCARTPANRWGDPEELVGATIFLSSKASDYVNGHVIFVDGGLTGCV
jgi:gluconate 5-dehydrogenase